MAAPVPTGSRWLRLSAWLRSQGLVRALYRPLPRAWREKVSSAMAGSVVEQLRFARTPAWSQPIQRPAAPTARPSEPGAPGLNVFGHFSGEFGLAEVARAYARALAGNGVPVALVDIGAPGNGADPHLARYHDASAPHAVNLVCTNPDDFSEVLDRIGPARLQGKPLLASWFWELEAIPEAWQPAIARVDGIVVATQFIQDAFARACSTPLFHVPVPMHAAVDSGLQRSDFGVEEAPFLFLYSFDFNSWMQRKNPGAVIAAFRTAFPPGDRSVRLLLKTSHGHRHPEQLQTLLSLAGADDRVQVRDDLIAPAHVAALQRCCDAFVSLHRSEGLGLGMAECMAIGKPVIATAWSGNLDFMTAQNSLLVDAQLVPVQPGDYPGDPRARWADADIDQAALAMRRVRGEPALAGALGAQARADIHKTLSSAACASGLRSAITHLLERTSLPGDRHSQQRVS